MKSTVFFALLVSAGVLSAQLAEPPPAVRTGPAPEVDEFLTDVRAALPALGAVSYEWHDTRDFENGTGTAEFGVFEARAPFYFHKFKDGGAIALGFDYSLADVQVDNEAFAWDGQLHGLFLPISYSRRTPGSDWFWLGQIVPGLRTDFESIDSDDFAFRTFGVAMRKFGDNLAIGFGAYFSYDVDGIFAVPGIGFTWKPSDDWLISLIPPQLAASWTPNDQWIISAIFRPRSFIADIDEGEDGPDIASVSYGRLGLSVRRQLFPDPNIWVNLQAGYTLYSEVELQRDGQSLFDTDLDNGFFAGASLEVLGW